MKTLFLGMIAALSAMVVKADFGDPEIARSIKIDPAEKMVREHSGRNRICRGSWKGGQISGVNQVNR